MRSTRRGRAASTYALSISLVARYPGFSLISGAVFFSQTKLGAAAAAAADPLDWIAAERSVYSYTCREQREFIKCAL